MKATRTTAHRPHRGDSRRNAAPSVGIRLPGRCSRRAPWPIDSVHGEGMMLKIHHPSTTEGEISLQTAASAQLASAGIRSPRLIRTASGALVAEARETDVVVVVSTSSEVESEGFDRASLALPVSQDDLVRAVAAANPRTVVVVNAGAPITLPWRMRFRRSCPCGSRVRSSDTRSIVHVRASTRARTVGSHVTR